MRKLMLALVLIVGCMSYSPVSAQTAKEWRAIHIVQNHICDNGENVIDHLSEVTWNLKQSGANIEPYGWGATSQNKGIYKVEFILSVNGTTEEAVFLVSVKTKEVDGDNDLGKIVLSGE